MNTIGDALFEEAHKKYNRHRLVIAFVNAEGAYDGTISHKEAVVCAMTSCPKNSCAFNPYRELPVLTLKTDLMECEPVSVSEFFKMCKVTKRKPYGRGKSRPIIDYHDGYEEDASYSLGTVSGDTLKIRYSYAFLAPPYSTHYEEKDFESFNDALFPNGRSCLEIYRWKDNFCDKFFEAGKEWWGTGLWSVYDHSLGRFVVIGASDTD